jgi:hypothetical protein
MRGEKTMETGGKRGSKQHHCTNAAASQQSSTVKLSTNYGPYLVELSGLLFFLREGFPAC